MAAQPGARVGGSGLPADDQGGAVATVNPSERLEIYGGSVAQPPVEAPDLDDGQIQFGYVKPAAVDGRVVEVERAGQPCGQGGGRGANSAAGLF